MVEAAKAAAVQGKTENFRVLIDAGVVKAVPFKLALQVKRMPR
jgi:hypothetical protein